MDRAAGTAVTHESMRQRWTEPVTADLSSMRARLRAALTAMIPSPNEQQADDLALVMNELLANAFLYAMPPIELVVTTTGRSVRLEVADASPDLLPPPPPQAALAETGRGLMLTARLSTRWGWDVNQKGKTVWAEFDV